MPQRRCYGKWILGRFCWSEMKEITWEGSGTEKSTNAGWGRALGVSCCRPCSPRPRPTQNERRNPSAVNSLVGSTNKKGLKFHASFHLPAPIRDLQCDNTTPLRTPTEALLGDACTRKEGCEKSQKMENSKSINVCNIKTGFRRKDTQENISDLLKRKLVLNISKAHITLAIISACITPKPRMPPSIFYKDPLASRESTCFDVHSGN